MAVLTTAGLQDLITVTQKDLGELHWTDLTTDIQEHHAMPQILKKEKVGFQSGVAIQRSIMIDHTHSASFTGLYEVDDVNVPDLMTTIEIPWRHMTASYAIERREIAMNREPARIVDLLKARRAGCMIAEAEKMEEAMFIEPTSDDSKTPYGILVWDVPKTTGDADKDADGGFAGDKLSGWSTYPGGLNNARWRNWAHAFVNITKEDLIRKWRRAFNHCQFKAPIKVPSYSQGASRYVFYVTYDLLETIEELGEAQNENLGKDIASMDGEMVFRGRPIRWVAKLDEVGTNRLFGIDWSTFYPVFLKGEYMNEQGPKTAPNQHTVQQVFIDCTYNVLCDDRRKLFVLEQTT